LSNFVSIVSVTTVLRKGNGSQASEGLQCTTSKAVREVMLEGRLRSWLPASWSLRRQGRPSSTSGSSFRLLPAKLRSCETSHVRLAMGADRKGMGPEEKAGEACMQGGFQGKQVLNEGNRKR
jgi:hypothetical protein